MRMRTTLIRSSGTVHAKMDVCRAQVSMYEVPRMYEGMHEGVDQTVSSRSVCRPLSRHGGHRTPFYRPAE